MNPKSLLIAAMLVCAGTPCLALTPQAADFLKSAGLDPASPDVVAADKDGVIQTTLRGDPATYSLEKLASEKKTNAVRSFVATRKVIMGWIATNGFEVP